MNGLSAGLSVYLNPCVY